MKENSRSLKILFNIPSGNQEADSEEEFQDEIRSASDRLNDVDLVADREDALLLATQRGILESQDEGNSWNAFPMSGLKSQKINKVLTADSGRIFAASDQGVYQFVPPEKRWEELKSGMLHANAKDLIFHPATGGLLYTVTSDGAFRIPVSIPFEIDHPQVDGLQLSDFDLDSLKQYQSREPDLASLRDAAIRYSDLNPQKIERWQRESRIKNLLPKLSGGIRKSRAKTIDVDRGGTNQPDIFISGPEDSSWSEDVSVSWDLGDLIWNEHQTAIDSRSKLMTELRNEILSNLTRLYFERRRLIAEYFLKNPRDPLAQLDLVEHIDELTGLLDAYTGGYFSKELERRNIKQPWNECRISNDECRMKTKGIKNERS